MNILLIFSNTMLGLSGSHRFIMPIGLWYICAFLKKLGHNVKIFHIVDHPEKSTDQLKDVFTRYFKDFSPDIIGFSFRDIYFNQEPGNRKDEDFLVSLFSVYYEKRIIDAIRELTDVPIVGGGPAFSQEPLLYMEYLNLDYGIIGEGEQAFAKLIELISSNKNVTNLDGLVYKINNKYLINKNSFIPDLSIIPQLTNNSPDDFHEKYYNNGGYMTLQTKRGCGFKCVYCNYPRLEGNEYRFFPISTIMETIKHFYEKYKIQYFYFVDSVFSTPPSFAKDICRNIINSDMNIGWETSINPGDVDEELIHLMKKAGCIGVSITPDSCCDEVLKSYNKGFSTKEIKNSIDLLHKYNIPFDFYIILGGIGDNYEYFQETFQFCQEHLSEDVLIITYGMFLHKGCEAYNIAVKEKFLPGSGELKSAVFSNDLELLKKFRYFYQGQKEKRKIIIELRNNRHSKWILENDYYYDEESGSPRVTPEFGCKQNQRPWYIGMKGLKL